jgi:hypothetical protein
MVYLCKAETSGKDSANLSAMNTNLKLALPSPCAVLENIHPPHLRGGNGRRQSASEATRSDARPNSIHHKCCLTNYNVSCSQRDSGRAKKLSVSGFPLPAPITGSLPASEA